MAPTLLVARANQPALSSTTNDVLTGLLAICLAALIMVGTYFLVRRLRQANDAAGLPHSQCRIPPSNASNSRSVFVYNEKQELLASSSGPISSPLPEIRITFPEEIDESGKHQSGRVVVLHIGDKGEVGLAPVDDKLPAYQQSATDRFQSLDIERIGGLKEKTINM